MSEGDVKPVVVESHNVGEEILSDKAGNRS